jgi:hypothetical protein
VIVDELLLNIIGGLSRIFGYQIVVGYNWNFMVEVGR